MLMDESMALKTSCAYQNGSEWGSMDLEPSPLSGNSNTIWFLVGSDAPGLSSS